MQDTDKTKYALYVGFDSKDYICGSDRVLKCYVVKVIREDNGMKGIRGVYGDGRGFDKLELDVNLYFWQDGGCSATVSMCHKGLTFSYLSEVETVAKLWRKVESQLNKANERDGYTGDTSEIFVRYCRALGLDTIVYKHAGDSVNYSDNEYRFITVADARSRVFSWIETVKAERTEVTV